MFASSVSVFLPCPFSDFSSYPRHLGDGGFVALSVSCVMEWNISLAIFLATKCVLCLEAIFSFFCPLASTGWRRTILISVRSTGPRPLVLNRAGLASAAATEPDCWARDRWVGVVCRPWLNRAGLHLFGVMCCYRAGGTLACLSPSFTRS